MNVTGLATPDAEGGAHTALFLLLGHHRWVTVIRATALYLHRVHNRARWCLYLGDDPAETILRVPRAVQAHAVIRCRSGGAWTPAWTEPDGPNETKGRR
ncbi:hypothetical protein [Streptomyces litmocidini]|uniref:hypothetical protein n=1 Tax=Streptomyces litmocidini TaxID=67318 RepID=UPI0036F75765